jgi:1-acyl-sn-glycerol-3-phosphate acyltransferase
MVERFVPSTPFVSTFLSRTGQILGTPDNCKRLLDLGAPILDFPEGVRGLSKTWRERYQLQRFGQGFMRIALATGVPVVPAVVIGAEEQAPSLYNLRAVGRRLGFPSFPVTPTHPWFPLLGMLPYPTRYRIYFGEPMTFEGNANDEDQVILQKVESVRSVMQQMIDAGLRERKNIFW